MDNVDRVSTPVDVGSQRVSFITWYPSCRRSDTIAAALGGHSHLVHFFKFKQPRFAPLKYLLQTFSSWRRLWQDRPGLVLVASPPVVAVAAVWLYCKVTGGRYVVDAHTGVFDDPRWTWALPLSRFFARGARSTVVTSEHLAAEVRNWGGHATVIGTVPVVFAPLPAAQLGSGAHVVVINTFSQDEPLDEVLRAAASLPEVSFHITGNLAHARTATTEAPPTNVRFTGWVTEDEYNAYLRAADAVMCLTTHDHTMQRGGYEAMALGQPLITSDWQLLRGTFSRGTVHIDNTPEQIVAAVQRVLAEGDALRAEMRDLAQQRSREFDLALQQLMKQTTKLEGEV